MINEAELYQKCIAAFDASKGYNGHHPDVMSIASELLKIGRFDIYRKAYADYYKL